MSYATKGLKTQTGTSNASQGHVDEHALQLSQSCLERYLTDEGRRQLLSGYKTQIEMVSAMLQPHIPGDNPLRSVSAHYAALTLRHDYTANQTAVAYPLFLLSAWLWDDMVDTNKGVAGAARALRIGLPVLQQAVTHGEFESLSRSAGRFRRAIDAAATMAAEAHTLIREGAGPYAPRIEREIVRFLGSFLDKVRLTHRHGHSQAHFEAVRMVCVGMQPCYELSYAIKAQSARIAAQDHLAYLALPAVQSCADAATRHCAAINDLFSMYKDRCLEDTANYPAILAAGSSLDGYFDGALRTVAMVQRTYAGFLGRCADLPASPSKAIVVETWEHMMEGNLLFHLLVPRYREGTQLVRHLLDSGMSKMEKRLRFVGLFTENATQMMPRAADAAHHSVH